MLLSHLVRHISLMQRHTLTLFQIGLYIRMYKNFKARTKFKIKILLKEAFQEQKWQITFQKYQKKKTKNR
jgi:hypothetical protein